MQIGCIYPQTEVESDPGAVKAFAQAAEGMGFAFIESYDHVVGANRPSPSGTQRPYNLDSPFHEPFVLLSYMAAITERIGFATGILILPQRQAALVANQAACLDVLSNGRFRMGIGTGWNEVEYEALGSDFATRGARMGEQVEFMRALWTQREVTFHGEYNHIEEAGLWPLPVQRPIPVWFGGASDRPYFGEKAKMGVLRRIARLGDGWIQQTMPRDRTIELIGQFHEFAREYGRDPAKLGVETRLETGSTPEDDWAATTAGWEGTGITHIAVNTMLGGLKGMDAHIKRLEAFRRVVPAT